MFCSIKLPMYSNWSSSISSVWFVLLMVRMGFYSLGLLFVFFSLSVKMSFFKLCINIHVGKTPIHIKFKKKEYQLFYACAST